MVDIDEDTQKALMLFNRRDEAEKQAAAVAKRLAKAERAKDEAAEAVKRLQGSGGETLAEAEAAWREALETWQNIRDGKEPVDEAPAEDLAEDTADAADEADAEPVDSTEPEPEHDEADEADAEPVDSTEPEPEHDEADEADA
ncbi:MAG: hypothetical protein VX268_04485, partial [Actinomycetota bacterium]|nr:hypothetical protein [Actinomycetota bacterium]